MIERVQIVFLKELVDNLRDRKSVLGALLYPLLGPLMLALVFTALGNSISDKIDKPLALPVIGAENAPALVQFLQQNGATIQPGPSDPEAEVRAGNYDVVLVIPPDYRKDFEAGLPATARIVADESRQSASASIRRAQGLLQAYSREIGSLRLLARGVDPNVIDALAIEEMDVSTPQSQAAFFLNILPYFIIFSVFIGGMYLVIDTIAGERERGSIEPLLTNPVARGEFLVGKLGATLVFTVVSVVETLLAFYLMLNVLPTESFGVQVSMSLETLGMIFLIAVPMMLLAAALQMIVATYTRSFKEAQNYLALLPLIPGLPGMVLAFLPIKPTLWMMLIPTFGQQLLINQVMRGEALDLPNLIASTLATLVVGILLVMAAIRLYGQERAVFGH